jgi:protein involved in polysaccharide export with SLBB domain
MKKYLLIISLLFSYSSANQIDYKIYGENLFSGNFIQNKLMKYNENYYLNAGDIINLKMWGSINKDIKLTIDSNGILFIPEVGTIKLAGTKYQNLQENIQKIFNNKYNNNIDFYVNIDSYTPINIFVSGNVNKPGLYQGFSNDTILHFIDKSKGIHSNGSYRNISIVRNNKIIKKLDLYNFLQKGELSFFQFKDGDVINVKPLDNYIIAKGSLETPTRIEIKESILLNDLKKYLQINIDTSKVLVERVQNNKVATNTISIFNNDFTLKNKDKLTFLIDNISKDIKINISGEHLNSNTLILPKGNSLNNILKSINYSKISARNDIILYRKSVALKQKEFLNKNLDDLERKILKYGSATVDEANIRQTETKTILEFIKRARSVETKGKVIISKESDLNNLILEHNDVIYIPKVSNIINISGSVKLPSSISYVKNMPIEEYIKKCGGLSEDALQDEILVIKLNGEVFKQTITNDNYFSDSQFLEPGDSIIVLSKVDSKNFQIVKDITQILYQLAVSAGVLVNI